MYPDEKVRYFTSFTIVKEITCMDEDYAKEIEKKLITLNSRRFTFRYVMIPEFTFERKENIVKYTSEYIKGNPCSIERMNAEVWPDCVLRPDLFTIVNYGRENFIVCDTRKKIFFVDLEDCGHIPMNQRKKRWNYYKERWAQGLY